MMNIQHFLRALFPSLQSQAELDEAYLAEAVDTHDLERRIREIDQRGRREAASLGVGRFGR